MFVYTDNDERLKDVTVVVGNRLQVSGMRNELIGKSMRRIPNAAWTTFDA